jgi:hypothetical protein
MTDKKILDKVSSILRGETGMKWAQRPDVDKNETCLLLALSNVTKNLPKHILIALQKAANICDEDSLYNYNRIPSLERYNDYHTLYEVLDVVERAKDYLP